MDVFEAQSDEYKESILPKNIRARVAVEALSGFRWENMLNWMVLLWLEQLWHICARKYSFEKFGYSR